MTATAQWIERLIRSRELESLEPESVVPVPRLLPPAGREDIDQVQSRAGFRLPDDYREFLAISNGMRNFYYTLSLLGCGDQADEDDLRAALAVRRAYEESDMLRELGIVDDPAHLFPIAGGDGAASAIFLVDPVVQITPGPVVWLELSDVLVFRSFCDLLEREVDHGAYYEAGKEIPFLAGD